MAYRLIPCSQPWFTTFGFFDPTVVPPRPQYYWLPGHTFGHAASVVNFNRFGELLVIAARALAAVPVEHYVDDFIIPDLSLGGSDASFSRRRRPSAPECSDTSDIRRLRGALGAVVFDPIDGSVRFAHAEPNWALLLSSWATDRKTYIAELETLAAVSTYNTYGSLIQGRKVLHFIDNTVALSALVHGYSGKPELAKMVNIFYLQMIGLRTSVFFDYVPSKANIADLPSRGDIARLRLELRGLSVRGGSPDLLAVPSIAEWSSDLSAWTRRHTLRSSTRLPV
eukprot:jgi/Chrpa1/23041/Chrysochromulina_OHIO_Genome00025716-RA